MTVEEIAQLGKLDLAILIHGLIVPYFQKAAQAVLFMKSNTASYPNVMTALRTEDNVLIAANSYDGLTDDEKAELLITNTLNNLGI